MESTTAIFLKICVAELGVLKQLQLRK